MKAGAQAHWLPDGRRLHLNHGPIDLIVEAFGRDAEVQLAYAQAVARFATVLDELVSELPELRRPADARYPRPFACPTAQRMETAVLPFAAEHFITPMAAVAGAVADEVLAAMTRGRLLDRAYVNNGGDQALHLAGGAALTIAIAGTGLADRVTLSAADPVRGIATSGWRGRSHSLGIADAVTVLAATSAAADAAATIIANAVDLPAHPAITRVPARLLVPDSDLGDWLVTTAVAPLTRDEIATALARGLAVAETCVARGLIAAAVVYLGGHRRSAGALPAPTTPISPLEEGPQDGPRKVARPTAAVRPEGGATEHRFVNTGLAATSPEDHHA